MDAEWSLRQALRVLYLYYRDGQKDFTLNNGGKLTISIDSWIGDMENYEPVMVPFTFNEVESLPSEEEQLYALINTEQDFNGDIFYVYSDNSDIHTLGQVYEVRSLRHPQDFLQDLEWLLNSEGGLRPEDGTVCPAYHMAFLREAFN